MGTDRRGIDRTVHHEVQPSRRSRVQRPRLDRHFRALLDGDIRTICIWAAAGSGKSSLIAQWAELAEAAGRSTLLVDGEQLNGGPPTDVLERLGPTERPTVVFVDDAHLASGWNRRSIERVIAAIPEHVSLVIAGRFDPFAHHLYLNALGVMNEIRQEELSFDVPEAMELARLNTVPLDEEAAAILVRRTAGWAAGLALAIPWLLEHGSPMDAAIGFDGDNRAVADYLFSEVIEALPLEDRNVLLQAAVADTVPAGLVALLTGRDDAGTVLRRLATRNSLIDDDAGAVAFHPVLLAYLQAEARRTDVAAAHRRHDLAAGWFAERGDGIEAIVHASQSGSRALLLHAVERFGLITVARGQSDRLWRSLHRLPGPPTFVTDTLQLLLDAPFHAGSARSRHLFAAIERHPSRIGHGHGHWHAVAVVLGTFTARAHPELETAIAALHTPAVERERASSIPLDILATIAEGHCLSRTGDLQRANRYYRRAIGWADDEGLPWLVLLGCDLNGTNAMRSGDRPLAAMLEDAQAQHRSETAAPDRVNHRALIAAAFRAYERCDTLPVTALERIARSGSLSSDLGVVAPASALVLLAQLDAADVPRPDTLAELRRWARDVGGELPRALAVSCIPLFGETAALLGRTAAHDVAALTTAALGSDSLEGELLSFLSLTERVRHNEHRLLEALDREAHCWRSTTIVCAWIVLADHAAKGGRNVEAQTRLHVALELAQSLRLERAFLHLGGLGIRLLQDRLGRFGTLDQFVSRVLECALRLSVERDDAALTSLTARERVLLRELPAHQTVAEIAAKQNVSVNTIKTHMRGIYQKLGANDRTSAVVLAQRRGLL